MPVFYKTFLPEHYFHFELNKHIIKATHNDEKPTVLKFTREGRKAHFCLSMLFGSIAKLMEINKSSRLETLSTESGGLSLLTIYECNTPANL